MNLSLNVKREDEGPSTSEVFKSEKNLKTSWGSDKKDRVYVKKELKSTAKNVPPKTPFKEPKSKKFRRIAIVSSSSESDDEKPIRDRKDEWKPTTTRIISSSSDSEDQGKKKPLTRQPRRSAKTVLKAENLFEEDIIEKVYRYEGVYWEYNRKKKDLFNCFECSKYELPGNVIEHFSHCHSVLIAE